MTDFYKLIQAMIASLGLQADPDSDLLVLEAQGHQAVVSSCRLPSGDEGVLIQISTRPLPQAVDGSTADALRMLHHLNHEARTMTPWRIVLSDDDVLMVQQTCLLSLGEDGVQKILLDGLERVEQLQALLDDWLPQSNASELPLAGGPNGHIVFA
jgi:hypothetical protein